MNERVPVPFWISIPAVLMLVMGFRFVFGNENTTIGLLFFVSCVFIARSASIQLRPIRDGAFLFFLLSGFAVLTEFLQFDALFMLAVNLVVLFAIMYIFFSSFDNIVYFPIVLGYLYIITSPAGVENLPMRILAILSGTLVVIIFYLLFQKAREHSGTKDRLEALLEMFSAKLRERSRYGESDLVTANYEDIRKLVGAILASIYRRQRRSKKALLIEESYIALTLSVERYVDIFLRLSAQGKPSKAERMVASELAGFLEEAKDYLSSNESMAQLAKRFEAFADAAGRDVSGYSPELFEVLETSTIAAHSLKRYGQVGRQKKPKGLEFAGAHWERDFIKSMKPRTLRFTFAFKYAVTVALTLFVLTAYHVEHALWLLIVVALMLRPYHEDTSGRTRARVGGNIVGTVLFLLAYYFVDNPTVLLALIAIAYLIFSRETGPTMRSVGASAFGGIGLAAHASHMAGTALGMDRVLYVFIGMFIAYLVSRFVLPYNITRSTRIQINAHRRFAHQLLATFLYSRTHINPPQVLLESSENKEPGAYIPSTLVFETLVLYANILEQQISFNNNIIHSKDLEEHMRGQHQLVNDIHYLYGVLSLETARRPAIAQLLEELSAYVLEASALEPAEFIGNHALSERLAELRVSLDAIFGFSLDTRVKVAVTTLRRVISALEKQVSYQASFES